MSLFYISFATNHRGFLGCTVVEALSAENALDRASDLGLNPGGEAAILEIPTEFESEPDVVSMRDRLVGQQEVLASGGARLLDLPEEIQEAFADECHRVCEDCNE